MKPTQSTQELTGGCLALFGLPFLAAGLFVTWLYFAGCVNWWRAQDWREVPCRITAADLQVSRDSDSGDSYKATASYHYKFGGSTYFSDRVSLNTGGDNIGGFQQQAHRELAGYVNHPSAGMSNDSPRDPVKLFRCYVNPNNPAEAVLYRQFRWALQALMAMFALTFPAVGAGLVTGGIMGSRLMRREADLRATYAGQPWKWQSAWLESSIRESSTRRVMTLYGYALWAGLVIAPLVLTAASSGAFQRDRSAWWLMGLVALWSLLAGASIRRILQRWAVGTTRFALKESPASPGGVLEGTILLEKPLPARASAELNLCCTKSASRGSGDNRATSIEKVWSHQESVPPEAVTRDPAGFRIPVRFALPADAPESGASDDAAATHVWKLELKVPGTPIRAEYEVPVFRAAGAPVVAAPSRATAPTLLDEAAADLPARLTARRIRAEFASDGTPLSILCPSARNRSLIVFLILFDVVWTGVAVLLLQKHAPLVFCIVWPASAAVIWLTVIWNLLHQRTATFSRTGVEVRNQLGPVVWTQVFDKAQITGFASATNMSSNQTTFYRVWLTSEPGKTKTLVDNITEATTAEALVKRLENWRLSPAENQP